MTDLEPGQTVSHYRIIEKLARGGQATTYKAEDTRLHRPVVIKIIRSDLMTGAPRHRFEREARLASALDHPNICTIYDVDDAEGRSYIVMQFLEGQTLKQLMAGRPLEPASALLIAVQIADALAVAHARGIVHRDVKPGKIIVNASGQARVLDFGLAKMLAGDEPAGQEPDADDVTKVGMPYGTPSYGSPERTIRLGNQNYPLFADNPKLQFLRADPRFIEVMNDLKRRWEARREQAERA
jgi:eukaryotic-like serine/threonine-protein kinase